ncbi:MAG TPA: MFS transporter [Nocardioidaceae bacterium]|nr:MFS transporter [Nocardioidaceae bacterium]
MSVDTEESGSHKGPVRTAISDTRSSIAQVFQNRNLRRIQLAFAGSVIGDWAYSTAVIVWAYDVGGAKAVGIWSAVRLLMMALFSPFAAGLADKYSRKLIMIAADLTRALFIVAATACLVLDTPAAPIFVLATITGLLSSAFRPAQAALLPSLVDSPEQLTASNGASSTIESLGFFLGPALGALLITVSNIETVWLLNAGTFLWSALLVSGVRPRPREDAENEEEDEDGADQEKKRGVVAEAFAGFTTIGKSRDLLLVTFLMMVQTLVAGSTVVFAVLLAIEVLDTGPEGVGYIDSMFGVGAVVGGFVAIARASRNKLATDLGWGVVLWSLPLLFVAWEPSFVVVFATMFLLGFGNPLVDVNYYTIIQRITPDRVLGRVFGATEGLLIATMALGAAVMPLAVEELELSGALTALALIVGVPAVLLLPACRSLDGRLRPPEGLELLRAIPMFSPLGPAKLETLARQLQRVTLPAGYGVLREGEDSDRFYVIESGGVEVTQGGAVLRHEGPGEYFGEIGLLRDVPRTANVTTTTETVLLALSRANFLGALAGSDESKVAADDIIARRLTA